MEEKKHVCLHKEPDKLYRIGMFAGMNHVTIKTLRYYDEQGILKPAHIDTESGYRYYHLNQMANLHQIIALKNMGFLMEEIKKIQEGESEKNLLLKKKLQIMDEMASASKKLAQIEQALIGAEEENTEHVLIKSIPSVIVSSMRRRIDSYDDLFYIMPEMGMEMERLGCVCAMPEYCFTLYPEPEYKEEKILVEICEAVTEKKADSEKVKFKVYPEIPQAACMFHRGPYETLSNSFQKILRYIDENNFEICGSIRESYIDGAWNKDREEDWLTEIQIPVRKRDE